MPRINRLRRSREKPGLTTEQILALLIGPAGGEFTSDAERAAAWWAHREELMSLLPPDGRGWGWVTYEGGVSVSRRATLLPGSSDKKYGFLPGEGGRVTAALRRLDSKTTGEQK